MDIQKIKRFTKYYRPHKTLFAVDLFCAFALSSLDLILPVLSKTMVNDVIVERNLDKVAQIGIALVVVYVLQAGFGYFINYWGHVMGSRIEYDLRKDIFNHIQTLPHSFFDKNQTGQIMSRIVNDLERLSEFAHHGPEDLFISLVMFIGAVGIMMSYEWKLALVVVIFIPIMLTFAINKRMSMSSAFADLRKRIAEINGNLENSLAGIRVVKAFANENFEKKKFDEGNTNYRDSMKTAFKAIADFVTGINFMIGLLNTTVLTYGGYLVIQEQLDVGSLLAFMLLVNFFMNPVRRLVTFVEEYQRSMTGFDRFLEIMDTRPDIEDDEKAVAFDIIDGNIAFENVTFQYENDNTKVLHDMNLKIESGKTLALVGPSGGGKTTLSHLLPRFYDVSKGAITIDGHDIRTFKLSNLRRHIGIVQQQVFLFTGTIRDNIAYGRIGANDEEIIRAAKKARIHDFIVNLPEGYDSQVGEKGVMLSGGQKQRISIARVFLKNPSILILDEATSALDNETEIKIQEALDELSKNRTTIVIAHRLSTIRGADEIVVLTDKGIEEKGSHEALLENNKLYTKLYNAQFKGFMPDELIEKSKSV